MYETLVTLLDAKVSPNEYLNLSSSDESWNWDRETKTKAQGLKAALSNNSCISHLKKCS